MEVSLRGVGTFVPALRGMGLATPQAPYVDTGGGITPATFASACCGAAIDPTNIDINTGLDYGVCDDFYLANAAQFGQGLFGANGPCSADGLQNLNYLAPVGGVAPVQPPPSAYSTSQTQTVPIVACPASVSPCPCNGQPVVDAPSAQALLTCQALQQSNTQTSAVIAAANASNAAQCAAQKVTCAANYFQTSVSADCSECVLSFANPYTLGMIAAAILVGLALVKSL